MADSDYIWVSTPHDPRSISGSDPFSAGNARLAAWYNCDLGNYVTGSLKDESWGYKLSALKDISGNSRAELHSHAKDGTANHRHLNSANYYRPVLGANPTGTNPHIGGHLQQFIMGSYALSVQEGDNDTRNLFLHNKKMSRAADNDTTSITWISGSASNENGYANVTLSGGYSLYTTMKYETPNGASSANFTGCTYPSAIEAQGNRNGAGNFSLNMKQDNTTYREVIFDWASGSVSSEKNTLPDDWHIVSGIYDNQNNQARWNCELFLNGKSQGSDGGLIDAGNYPRQHNNKKKISIGGGDTTYGGGNIENTSMTNSINGVHEMFVFDDALSQFRNAQMSAYLCDRLDRPLSSSLYHSQFGGLGKGLALAHTTLSNPLSGQGDNCRLYEQEATSSLQTSETIQYETAGGAFARSSLDSGAYYKPTSDKALSLRMWVRTTRIADEQSHAGSQACLVAKATSPHGNKIDNIKGYALKFGTMVNGSDTGALKFVLSLRDSDRWNDGQTTNSCTDIVVTSSNSAPGAIQTPGIDLWYQIRLDVIPYGQIYDKIQAYASLDASTYYTLGDAHIIKRENSRYRHWCNDLELPVNSDAQNGIYNGYYISMSSSNGHSLKTKYYLGKFEIHTDTV